VKVTDVELPAILARTLSVPAPVPSVKLAVAKPDASVDEAVEDSVPPRPPVITDHVTDTPDRG
jgi:hypothetical protein